MRHQEKFTVTGEPTRRVTFHDVLLIDCWLPETGKSKLLGSHCYHEETSATYTGELEFTPAQKDSSHMSATDCVIVHLCCCNKMIPRTGQFISSRDLVLTALEGGKSKFKALEGRHGC
jgi:hypothetical protein